MTDHKAESARLSETECETLDAILVALWQAESEAGYAFGRTKIEKAVECILTDRLDRRLGEHEKGFEAGYAQACDDFGQTSAAVAAQALREAADDARRMPADADKAAQWLRDRADALQSTSPEEAGQ